MKDFCGKVWSVFRNALLLQCTIEVVHYNRDKTIKKYNYDRGKQHQF